MWFIQSVCFSFDYGWKSFLVILNNNCIVEGGNGTLGRWMVTLELQQDFGSRLKMKKKYFGLFMNYVIQLGEDFLYGYSQQVSANRGSVLSSRRETSYPIICHQILRQIWIGRLKH